MKVERDQLKSALSQMKAKGYDYLVKITAVDYIDRIDAIYIIRNIKERTSSCGLQDPSQEGQTCAAMPT